MNQIVKDVVFMSRECEGKKNECDSSISFNNWSLDYYAGRAFASGMFTEKMIEVKIEKKEVKYDRCDLKHLKATIEMSM